MVAVSVLRSSLVRPGPCVYILRKRTLIACIQRVINHGKITVVVCTYLYFPALSTLSLLALNTTGYFVSSLRLTLKTKQPQLSWKTGCWGRWISLADAENIEFVEFDTYIGWQTYGKGDKMGLLSEVSRRAAAVGGLAGGMHTLIVFVSLTFLFFSLSALWLSHDIVFCLRRGPSEEEQEEGGPAKPAKHGNPLGLGRDCHRWMFVMAGFDIFAGLWCFGIGCAGFYLAITGGFTDGLEVRFFCWCCRRYVLPLLEQ